MQKQQYGWLLATAMALRQQDIDDDQGDPLSLEMRDVFAVGGRLVHADRQAANEEVVAALILVLIYAWNCAKYRAQIGNSDQTCAKYFQNAALLFFSAQFALTRAIWSLHEKHGQNLEPAQPCQMNSTLTLGQIVPALGLAWVKLARPL